MPRKRSPHPGVVVRPARPEQYQKAQLRYTDPDTGKQRYETVPDGADATALARRKSLELANRRQAIADGAPRLTGSALTKLVGAYFAEALVRESTVEQYGYSAARLLEWGGVKSPDDLTLAKLRQFRAWLAKLPGRGAHTLNRDLRQVAVILEHSRKAGRCPRLSAQDISDGLERVKAAHERKDYCQDPRAALAASMARGEDLGCYVALLLLTGMRATEALCVRAESIDFKTGLIRLQAHEVKTASWRDVELSFTMAGYMLCEALVLGKPPGERLFGDMTLSRMRALRQGVEPVFTFQELRRTASTYLCSMPNVGLWRAAKSLGHHPEIARKHYAGVVRTDEHLLERALGIDDLVRELAAKVRSRRTESLPATALVRGPLR